MKRARELRWLRVCVAILMAVFSAVLRVSAQRMDPVWLNSKRIDRLTREFGYEPHNAWISRNEQGNVLFLSMSENGRMVVQIVSEAGSRTNWVPGGHPVVRDDGRPICFMTPKSLVFGNAQKVPRTAATRFGFSPNRDYFFLSEGTNSASIFQTVDLRNPLFKLPQDFEPQTIFSPTNEIYVFGLRFGRRRYHTDTWGMVYSNNGTSFHLQKEIDLSRFGGVDDMDTTTHRLLVESKGEILRTWGLYDLITQKYRSFGLCRGRGLFLDTHFRKFLEARWKSARRTGRFLITADWTVSR